MKIKKMKGHSGCQVWLHEEKGKKFIRKTSSSKEYNPRLMRQIQKQKDFNCSTLKAPIVLSEGIEDGLSFFDMEFVGGVPFHNFIEYNSISSIWPFFDKIEEFMRCKDLFEVNIDNLMMNKVRNLYDVLDRDLRKYCTYCLAFDWSRSQGCYSHGDLTFENIIIYGSEIYLIDFLDTFVEVKSIDYSKILQDILLRWSWRNEAKTPLVKNMLFYDRITANMNEKEVDAAIRMLVMNLLRIVPYANEETLTFVKSRLKYLEERFDI